ncbi:MAG TPA: prepilin peptidase [Thermoanaerobaculia bacterium]|nr:prepilin peptidase [Thermoanaerobaculia bacterium]
MSALLSFYAFALGAIVGSFLNVVIHRYPREESIIFPGSHCPRCNAAIQWYDNVPILSFVILRGRCRACHAPIAIRYVLVELANALFYLAIFLRTGLTFVFPLAAAIVSMLIVLIFIDADIQILPDVIDLPGIVLGIVIGATQAGARVSNMTLSSSLIDSVAGAVIGASVLLTIALAYRLLRKIEGMGLGDVKMMAMLGATVGWEPLFGLLVIASVAGAVVGLIVASRSSQGMQAALPFGVFLGFGALAIIFFGPTLWSWYLALLPR